MGIDDLKVLDLGCGGSKVEGAVGIDRLALPGVDIVRDLDMLPYPFEDEEFDRVICMNVMEHLDKPLDVLVELHRICKPKAIVHIESPHFSSADFFTDPTHKHPFSSRSFDYLVPGTQLFDLRYHDKVGFAKKRVRINFFGVPGKVAKLLGWLANNHTLLYERRLAFMLPAHQVIFDLEVIK